MAHHQIQAEGKVKRGKAGKQPWVYLSYHIFISILLKVFWTIIIFHPPTYAGEWNVFTITPKTDFDNALGNIVVSFDGPSKPQLEFEYESRKVIVKYWPELPGDYKLEIMKGGSDIPGSPFKCKIEASNTPDPSKIRVLGDALTKATQSTGNIITVDVTEAHIAGNPFLRQFISLHYLICEYL